MTDSISVLTRSCACKLSIAPRRASLHPPRSSRTLLPLRLRPHVCVCNIKNESDEMEETEPSIKTEKEDEIVPKEERDGGSENGLEEGFDQDKTEEEEDEDALSEPQDLSLVDYLKRYDNMGGVRVRRANPPARPSQGKLSCDICGLSCVSINVLLVHKRSHTGERPFHCPQCGASFTQKGNLLRHIKLHSGEKPFKCPMCSYACRRRDALSGHLRTHSVEKPFKCNHCSRSYKQRSSLEEHRDRCHLYIQNKAHNERACLLLDRLASNVAKRKSSMPQKFTGEKRSNVCNHKREQVSVQLWLCPADSSSALSSLLKLFFISPRVTIVFTDGLGDNGVCLDLSFNRDVSYPLSLTRNDHSPLGLTNGHKMGPPLLPPNSQPPVGMDSFSSEVPNGISFMGHLMRGVMHYQQAQPVPLSPLEALRSMEADGGSVYPCGHCKLIFLDYVMYTIHMGCHGFRDPFECNVCGHRSRDRYEFTSHIARGEHGLKYNSLKYS
ncbi:hypothetical protein WMY93_007127 [Mugilogobius chulae]|uniref:C2H2-type domain-containing protein n=1 Tax=Mugilogobius chulae TaxID=88201 RepID=A0AAW0PPB9_9GOBI